MTFAVADRILETSTTTGTGTLTLAGAQTGYQALSTIGANNACTYFLDDGTNWEVGIGTYLSGPSRLQRDTVLASSNGGSAVNWGGTTISVRVGLPAAGIKPTRRKSRSVAGNSNVTLTQDEQRCDVLELTGALTGNIDVIVDATVWKWATVYNNTSGGFTLTVKVSGQTGVNIPQGAEVPLYCNGTDVRTATYGQYRRTQVFTASGTWTKPAGLKAVRVTVVGGGGGAGGANATGDATGGAGGGGFSIKTIAAASLGSTETVTVGAGGAKGTSAGTSGSAGGTSSFGAHCSATGGAATAGASGGGLTIPAVGGGGSGGDINGNGGSGTQGSATGWGGTGGDSLLGGGGLGTLDNGTGTGNAGKAYGGGGGGARANSLSSQGGDGAAGIVIVEEFF